MNGPRFLPVGDSAVSIELGSEIDPITNARVQTLDRALTSDPFPGLRETVPTYRSLLVVYDSGLVSLEEIRDRIEPLIPEHPAVAGAPTLHVIPTVYGGEAGPDLAEVADRTRLSENEVIACHCGREYTAFMLGFLPGFAYLGLLDSALETSRRDSPRPRVPAGSVAVAGLQTGIYPSASPGGWNIIGRTASRLFDPTWTPPCRILPGDRVRFEPTPVLVSADDVAIDGRQASTPAAPPSVEVMRSGLRTTVQDAGRFGCRRFGIAWAGALDRAAHRGANEAVGNPEDAPVLECTATGPTLRFLATTRFAVAGADFGAVLHRTDLGTWPVPLAASVLARAGNVLSFSGRQSGFRVYIAFAGGIDVPLVLGSCSTDLTAGFGGFGGRALCQGDRISLGARPGEPRELDAVTRRRLTESTDVVRIRVVLGPQDDHFDDAAISRFLSETYAVETTSDRVGCRLSGAGLPHRASAEIVTDGMVPGCIQVPPDGRPIVMLADGPTTGGYPKIATVVSADQPLLAQLLPGNGRVRFEAIPAERTRSSA